MKTLKSILLIAFGVLAMAIKAQTTGSVKGTITNEQDEKIPFAIVGLIEDSVVVKSTETDLNGDFTFRQVTPGLYTVRIQMSGYKIKNIKNVEVKSGEIAYLYKTLKEITDTLHVVEAFEFWDHSILENKFANVKTIRIDQIDQIAINKNDIVGIVVALSPSVLPTNDGKDMYVRGSRRGTTAYYIDGNRTVAPEMVPGLGIASIQVITGGVPAEYGDATGGFVVVETKDYLWEMKRKNIKEENSKHSKEAKSTAPADSTDDN